MRFRFVLDGPKYSKHKGQFKKLLEEHGLRWRGSRDEFVWASGRERVVALFDRDEVKDITLKATLMWEGRAKTRFLNELKTWVFSLGGESAEERGTRTVDAAAKARIERELALWDAVHRPDVEALRAQGRPEEWIERDLKEWKKAREGKRKDLMATYGS